MIKYGPPTEFIITKCRVIDDNRIGRWEYSAISNINEFGPQSMKGIVERLVDYYEEKDEELIFLPREENQIKAVPSTEYNTPALRRMYERAVVTAKKIYLQYTDVTDDELAKIIRLYISEIIKRKNQEESNSLERFKKKFFGRWGRK